MKTLYEKVFGNAPANIPYVEIGSFGKNEKGKNADRHCELAYSITKGGLIPTSEYFKDAKVTSDDTSGYRIVRKNWFVYSPSRIDVGSINYLRDQEEVIVSPLNVVFSVDEQIIIPQYLLYYLQSRQGTWQILTSREGIEGTGRKLLPFEKFSKILVPLPSLEMQAKIVKLLDSFSNLTDILINELAARKKQYTFYLNKFFEEQEENVVPLSSLGQLTRGKRFVHADAVDNGVPCIHYGELYTFYGAHAKTVRSHIREELRDKMRYARRNDVIIVGAGENNTDIGIGVAWEGDEEVAVHDACYTFSHSQNPRYISYYLRSDMYHEQIKKYVSSGKICAISAVGIGKALIPVPTLEKQAEIVSMLNAFEELCNSNDSGIPGEITRRNSQYEYYRDQIFDFEGRLQR